MRRDDELREMSGHVLWHVRQFCRLGAHLRARHEGGNPVLLDALSAASLEAFLIHARALADFVWRSRDVPKGKRAPYEDDGLAEDYFDGPGGWSPAPMPARLAQEMRRIGWGVAHVSYRRLDPVEAWGWDFGWTAVVLYAGLVDFATRVRADRVVTGFGEACRREFIEELGLDSRQALARFGALGHSVGTPAFALWLPPKP